MKRFGLPGMKEPSASAFCDIQVVLTASAGADISQAIAEGIQVALETGATVTFPFNGTPIRIDPRVVMLPILEQYDASRAKEKT